MLVSIYTVYIHLKHEWVSCSATRVCSRQSKLGWEDEDGTQDGRDNVHDDPDPHKHPHYALSGEGERRTGEGGGGGGTIVPS